MVQYVICRIKLGVKANMYNIKLPVLTGWNV